MHKGDPVSEERPGWRERRRSEAETQAYYIYSQNTREKLLFLPRDPGRIWGTGPGSPRDAQDWKQCPKALLADRPHLL